MAKLLEKFGLVNAPFGDRVENYDLFEIEPKVKTFGMRKTLYGEEGSFATRYVRD